MPKLKPMTIIFIGALIVVLGGIVGAYGTYQHNKASSEKSDKIVSLQNALIQKSEELTKVQSELLKHTTGGNSWGEVEFLRVSDGKGGWLGFFYFIKHGEYPLYEVSVYSVDRNLIDKGKMRRQNYIATLSDLEKYDSFDLGNITGVDGGKTFHSLFALTENHIYDFLFVITTRNQRLSQEFKFIMKGDSVAKATRIKGRNSSGEETTLVDKADESFPGYRDGKIIWE